MPIDPKFQKNRKKVGKEKGIAIWGPVDPPEKLGIYGTHVAVDWDICTGCGICLEVCPLELYEWVETSGHPTSEKKAYSESLAVKAKYTPFLFSNESTYTRVQVLCILSKKSKLLAKFKK